MKYPFEITCCILALLAGCSSQERSSRDPRNELTAPTGVDGLTAEELIGQLRQNYRQADVYLDNAEYRERFVLKEDGQAYLAPPHVVSVAFARPNRFRLSRQVPETTTPGLTVTAICDGTTLRAAISDLHPQILERPAPEALSTANVVPDDVLRDELFPVPVANLFPQLDLLLAGQRDDALSGSEYKYLEDITLESGPCTRVQFATPDGPRIAWIDKESRLLRRLDLPSDAARQFRDPQGAFSKYELWIDFNDASIDVALSDNVFALPLPEGANVVEQFERPTANAPVGQPEMTP